MGYSSRPVAISSSAAPNKCLGFNMEGRLDDRKTDCDTSLDWTRGNNEDRGDDVSSSIHGAFSSSATTNKRLRSNTEIGSYDRKNMAGPLHIGQMKIMKTEMMVYPHQDMVPSNHIILEANFGGKRWKEGQMKEK